jgi:hypothetical protein
MHTFIALIGAVVLIALGALRISSADKRNPVRDSAIVATIATMVMLGSAF